MFCYDIRLHPIYMPFNAALCPIALLATALAQQHGTLGGLFFVGGFLGQNPIARALLAYFCSCVGA